MSLSSLTKTTTEVQKFRDKMPAQYFCNTNPGKNYVSIKQNCNRD